MEHLLFVVFGKEYEGGLCGQDGDVGGWKKSRRFTASAAFQGFSMSVSVPAYGAN